jgi:VWFA-related protein
MSRPQALDFKRISFLLVLAATFAVAPCSATGQPPSPGATTLKVTSRLTQVSITATDANGHPVHGLTQSDFAVKEDGKSQPIKNFEEFGTAKPAPPAPVPQLPPNVYTNAQPQAPTTGAVNVLLIDDVTTGSGLRIVPENPANSRSQATKYLRAMPPGTQVILLQLGVRLKVIQPLTTDRDVLFAALHSVTFVQNVRTSLPMCPPDLCPLPPQVDACLVANAQSQTVVDTLDNVSAYLAGIKGRKNLIWFTPGIPWLTNFGDYDGLTCMHDYTTSLLRDYNLLAAAQVAVYPVDPAGVLPFPPNPGIYPGEGTRAPAPDPVMLQAGDHVSMEDFAESTGGQAYYNTNDLASAIGDAIAVGTDYYSLSYVPPLAKYDGQFHKISVSVDRPGVRLVYRKGYTSIDPNKTPTPPAQKATDKTQPQPDAALHAAMAHGAAPSTQILFTVGVTPSAAHGKPGDPVLGQLNPNVKLKGKSLTRYDFNYRVLPGDITLTEASDGKRQGSVEFTVAAYDGTGEMLNILRQTVSFEVAPNKLAAFLARPLPVLLRLDLPPGDIFVRAAVRDIPSSNLGTIEIPVAVAR